MLASLLRRQKANAALEDLAGFRGLRSGLPGALVVDDNPRLTSLAALAHVTAVGGGGIEVVGNAALRQLGLNAVVRVVGGVRIERNGALTSVASLEAGLLAVEGDVLVKDVDCVSAAEVARWSTALVRGDAVEYTLQVDSTDSDAAGDRRGSRCAEASSMLGGFGSPQDVTVGHGVGRVCGGHSAKAGGNGWKALGTSGLYVDVDTAACAFGGDGRNGALYTPPYVSSIRGDSAHWQLTGVNSIYAASPSSFRVFVWHPVRPALDARCSCCCHSAHPRAW